MIVKIEIKNLMGYDPSDVQLSAFNLLIGRSGSGKSLLMKSLFAVLYAKIYGVDVGDVLEMLDVDVQADIDFRGDVSEVVYIPTFFFLTDGLAETLKRQVEKGEKSPFPLSLVHLYRLSNSCGKGEFADIVGEVSPPSWDRFTVTTSVGMVAWLMKCGAIGPGSVLMMDTPEAGLDPTLWKKLLDILRPAVARGLQVILTTHDYFFYTYCRAVFGDGELLYKDGRVLKSIPLSSPPPPDEPIVHVPLEVFSHVL